MALGLITTFTACSNDDDSDIPVYSLKDVDGNYSGTMLTESDPPVNPQTNSPKEEQPEGATVTAEVKDNQVMIKKLPVDDLIKSIVDEETAGIIIENLDDINYNIPYTAAFNDDSKGSILLQLKPEPLYYPDSSTSRRRRSSSNYDKSNHRSGRKGPIYI